jgi:hypothetical protein
MVEMMEQVGAVYFIRFVRSRDIGSTVDHYPVLRKITGQCRERERLAASTGKQYSFFRSRLTLPGG